MKHWNAYHVHLHSLPSVLMFWVVFACAFFLLPQSGIGATRQEELQSQISNKQQEIQALEEEVKQHQRDLEVVGGEKKTLQSAVKEIDVTRKKLGTDITITQKKIDTTTLSIEELGIEIKDKEIRIVRGKEVVAKIVRILHESSQESLIELLLANTSLSDVFTDADNLSRIEENMSTQIGELKVLQKDLLGKKTVAEEAKGKLLSLNREIADRKRIADAKRQEQALLLKETANKEANYKKLLAEKEAYIKQFEQEIEEYENQLRIELDPTSIPRPGTKSLAWPLDAVFVTQKFGSTQSAKRLYTSGTHNGVDFRASIGTPVRAAGSGIVIETGDTDKTCRGASYGKWVLVKHNNGLSTLYAHLELIRVNPNEEISAGNTIGYSGKTGYSTGPHLHFTVFATAAVRVDDIPSVTCKNAIFHIPVSPRNGYLNPEDYL